MGSLSSLDGGLPARRALLPVLTPLQLNLSSSCCWLDCRFDFEETFI